MQIISVKRVQVTGCNRCGGTIMYGACGNCGTLYESPDDGFPVGHLTEEEAMVRGPFVLELVGYPDPVGVVLVSLN